MRTSFSWPYKTEQRKKIMQSAMENFSKKGFDRTRMEDIAAAAGLAKGTLYLYFKELISFWIPYQRGYQG
jgi:AcrR family transcriptional regulator